MTVQLLRGDCRATLPTLEPGAVQSVITSPPYYGLRDYGLPPLVWGGDAECAHVWETAPRGIGHVKGNKVASTASTLTNGDYQFGALSNPLATTHICSCGAWLGSLGLEPTPDLYIEHLVECVRHVWRVLRDDGVLWLNLGSSYFGSGKGPTGVSGIGDQARRQGFVGGRSKDAPSCGTSGTAPRGYPDGGSSSTSLCDECRVALQRHSSRNDSPHAHESAAGVNAPNPAHTGTLSPSLDSSDSARQIQAARVDRATLDPATSPLPAGVLPPSSLESTLLQSSQQPPADCRHCANCGACLSVLRSSSRDAQLCARKRAGPYVQRSVFHDEMDRSGSTLGTSETGDSSACRNSDRALTQGDFTIAPHHYKPKDEMLMPFRVALALQADGWYVRSVIPWLKRNSMPESVTDRPATSVEYVFLLAKSRTYYWDADAVRVAQGTNTHSRGSGHTPKEVPMGQGIKANSSFHAATNGVVVPGGRSRRNSDWFFESWQGLMLDEDDNPLALVVNPQPFTGAHFATFPAKLVEPMIKASTRPGDTVLDPFGGAGTVGLVADRLQRNAILCELKPAYADMGAERITADAPMFAEVDGGGERVPVEPVEDKQGASGLRRYAGFNARWDAKEVAD